jgi:hypothetical protein
LATKRRRSIFLVFPLSLRFFRSSREPLLTQEFLLTFLYATKKDGQKPVFFVAQREGFAPLAARPARQLSIADFASYFSFFLSFRR